MTATDDATKISAPHPSVGLGPSHPLCHNRRVAYIFFARYEAISPLESHQPTWMKGKFPGNAT